VVKVLDVTTGKCIVSLKGHKNVTCVAYSPDPRFMATGSTDCIKIWDIIKNKCIATLKEPCGNFLCVAYSPDPRFMATGFMDCIKIWNVATQKCIATLRGHTDFITTLSFSREGNFLASGSLDFSVNVWDLSGMASGTVPMLSWRGGGRSLNLSGVVIEGAGLSERDQQLFKEKK
jgi:WD40 repeat protein